MMNQHRIIPTTTTTTTTTTHKSLSLLLYSLFLLFVTIRFDDVAALITTTRTRTRPLKSATTALFLQGGGRKKEYDDTNNCKTNNEIIIPDIEILRNEIRKWSRVRRSSSRSGALSSSTTQAVVVEDEAPNQAAKALREMFRYYNPSNSDSSMSSSSSSSGSSNNNNSRQRSRQTVDVIDCNQVINAWSNSYQTDAPQQAVSILKSMATMYEQNNIYNTIIRPDVFTYTSVIHAFSKRGDYNEAMKIFKIQMNDYKNKHNVSAKVRYVCILTMPRHLQYPKIHRNHTVHIVKAPIFVHPQYA
jgi:pentatricopeptide repeat protein